MSTRLLPVTLDGWLVVGLFMMNETFYAIKIQFFFEWQTDELQPFPLSRE
jgi:hypothetical protein